MEEGYTPDYINEPDNKVLSWCENVLVFLTFFIIVNCFFPSTTLTNIW